MTALFFGEVIKSPGSQDIINARIGHDPHLIQGGTRFVGSFPIAEASREECVIVMNWTLRKNDLISHVETVRNCQV